MKHLMLSNCCAVCRTTLVNSRLQMAALLLDRGFAYIPNEAEDTALADLCLVAQTILQDVCFIACSGLKIRDGGDVEGACLYRAALTKFKSFLRDRRFLACALWININVASRKGSLDNTGTV